MPTLLMCPATAEVESLKRFHRVPDGALLDRWGQEPRMLAPGGYPRSTMPVSGRGLATGAATALEATALATPAGWALIAAALAAPGVVAAGSMVISSLGEYEAGALYDKVLRWQVGGP